MIHDAVREKTGLNAGCNCKIRIVTRLCPRNINENLEKVALVKTNARATINPYVEIIPTRPGSLNPADWSQTSRTKWDNITIIFYHRVLLAAWAVAAFLVALLVVGVCIPEQGSY